MKIQEGSSNHLRTLPACMQAHSSRLPLAAHSNLDREVIQQLAWLCSKRNTDPTILEDYRSSIMQSAIRTVTSSRKKCAFCLRSIVDPGSTLLSKVNQDNFTNWCEIMLKMESKDVTEIIKNRSVCRFCIWDARFYHKHDGGSKNSVWWSTDDKHYRFYERNMIKPCEVNVKKLTDFQIHQWTEDGKKRFKCLVCGLKHGTQNALYLHNLWRHPETKFRKCYLCKEFIDINEIGMQEHFDEVHKGEISTSLKTKVLKCHLCDKIYIGPYRKYRRSRHLKKVHPNAAVRCAWFGCCRYFRSYPAMEKHAYEKHSDVMAKEKVLCIFCGAQYLDNLICTGHVRKKHKREAHFCPIHSCSRYYKSEEEMQAHVKEVHEKAPTDEKIWCNICGRRISTLRLHQHMRMKHSKEAFKCKKAICRDYFPTKAAATEHFKTTHASEKKAKRALLSCGLCQFQTRYPRCLEMHIVAKHFPRTLKCPECPKKFASKEHIREHARKTHNKNRKKCPHCGIAPAIYNSHVVNTKCLKCLKPFKCFALSMKHRKKCKLSFHCDICNTNFKMEAWLLNHFKLKHRRNDKNVWLGAKKYKQSGYKCEPCKIYFEHEGFQNTHIRFFHLERNTCTCHICGKICRCKSIIEHHLVKVHNILRRKSVLK